MEMANGWMAERRVKQAAAIHRWAPWRSAGVRTEAGKRVTRMNALRHGNRSASITKLRALLRHLEAKTLT